MHRQSLQLSALCPPVPAIALADDEKPGADTVIETANVPAIMKRSAWIQAYCARVARAHERRLAQERHKSLEVITNAWVRFLILVGLR
jgi:hypothetical protein